MELEAQSDAQTVQDIEQEQDPVAVQERGNFYEKRAAIYYLANLQEIHGQMIREHGHHPQKPVRL